MILTKDSRYRYSKQVTKWLASLDELLPLLEPFRGFNHCVIRRNRRGKYALFTRGDCTPKQRYKLEVSLVCTLIAAT
jgi:hypothetical protein